MPNTDGSGSHLLENYSIAGPQKSRRGRNQSCAVEGHVTRLPQPAPDLHRRRPRQEEAPKLHNKALIFFYLASGSVRWKTEAREDVALLFYVV